MAEPGAVSWQFERKGMVTVPLSNDEDKVMEIAMEGGRRGHVEQRRRLGRDDCAQRPRRRAPGPR